MYADFGIDYSEEFVQQNIKNIMDYWNIGFSKVPEKIITVNCPRAFKVYEDKGVVIIYKEATSKVYEGYMNNVVYLDNSDEDKSDLIFVCLKRNFFEHESDFIKVNADFHKKCVVSKYFNGNSKVLDVIINYLKSYRGDIVALPVESPLFRDMMVHIPRGDYSFISFHRHFCNSIFSLLLKSYHLDNMHPNLIAEVDKSLKTYQGGKMKALQDIFELGVDEWKVWNRSYITRVVEKLEYANDLSYALGFYVNNDGYDKSDKFEIVTKYDKETATLTATIKNLKYPFNELVKLWYGSLDLDIFEKLYSGFITCTGFRINLKGLWGEHYDTIVKYAMFEDFEDFSFDEGLNCLRDIGLNIPNGVKQHSVGTFKLATGIDLTELDKIWTGKKAKGGIPLFDIIMMEYHPFDQIDLSLDNILTWYNISLDSLMNIWNVLKNVNLNVLCMCILVYKLSNKAGRNWAFHLPLIHENSFSCEFKHNMLVLTVLNRNVEDRLVWSMSKCV